VLRGKHSPRHQAAVFQQRNLGRDPQPAAGPTRAQTGAVREMESAIEGGQTVSNEHNKFLGVDIRRLVSESVNWRKGADDKIVGAGVMVAEPAPVAANEVA
jgi:hypothetical protein